MPATAAGRGLARRCVVWPGLTLLATATLLVATARPAMAHATLLETTPTADEVLTRAPDEVSLSFDEPVEVVDGAVRVFGPDGDRVDRGQVDVEGTTLLAPIDGNARGTYTVAWRVLSGDSHNLSGSFVFHVGERTGAVEIDDTSSAVTGVLAWIGRFLALSGSLLLFGAGLLSLLNGPEIATSSRFRRMALAGAAAGVVGTAIVVWTRAAETSGRSALAALTLIPELATETRSGRLSLVALLAFVAAIAVAWRRGTWERRPWLVGAAAVVAMASVAASGHAWTADPRWTALLSDLVHQVAAGIWIGGVAALAIALRASGHRRRLAARFSTTALAGAVVVAVSGTVSAFIQIGSWDALTSTGYGQLVLVKVGGFLILVTFGYLNRRHLVPIVERRVTPLLRSIRWELVVAAGVLMVTAVLVDQPPGRTAVAQPYSATESVDDATVQLTVTPARAGINDLHLYFYEVDSGEVLPVDAVEVTASTADLPPRRLDVTPVTVSHVSVLGASLTAPGTWSIEVILVRAGTPTNVTFEVPIR